MNEPIYNSFHCQTICSGSTLRLCVRVVTHVTTVTPCAHAGLPFQCSARAPEMLQEFPASYMHREHSGIQYNNYCV